MNKRAAVIGALLIGAIMTTGCATIMHGDRQSVSIVSGKENTKIKVLDEAGNVVSEGTNNLTVALKRGKEMFKGNNYKIVAETGDEKQEVLLNSGVNGAYVVGNLFFGGLIGWIIVDPASGAMWTIKTPDGQPAKEVKIFTKDVVPKEVMEKAEKVEQK